MSLIRPKKMSLIKLKKITMIERSTPSDLSQWLKSIPQGILNLHLHVVNSRSSIFLRKYILISRKLYIEHIYPHSLVQISPQIVLSTPSALLVIILNHSHL